jgi:hypothetical protein
MARSYYALSLDDLLPRVATTPPQTPTVWHSSAPTTHRRCGPEKPSLASNLPQAAPVGVWDPTAHPGLPLKVLLGRTVLPTVARWFVLGARETMDNFIHVRAA